MRPFIQFSFKQLEAEFKKSRLTADITNLQQLEKELEQRKKNPSAPVLKAEVAKAIAKIGVIPQRDLFDRQVERPAAPPAVSRRVQHIRPTAQRRGGRRHKPTPEQKDAIDAFVDGRSLKINAYAGTGKTSTLQMLANATGLRGQYIAFNKDIVTDAKDKFPNSVNCSTSHSLAMRAAPSAYKQDMSKLTGKVNAIQLAEIMQLKRQKFDQHHALLPKSQAFLFLETVKKFAQSADEDLDTSHVPAIGSLRTASDEVAAAMRQFALEGGRAVWRKMLDERDSLPMGHDGYLKLWGLSRPHIAADFILLDEAQDTNPVVLDVLRRQPAQMVYVGDKYQQIYEWRGAVNAMEEIQTAHSTFLTTSFRFGPAVADLASQVLKLLGEGRGITGNTAISSRLTPLQSPDAVLARTNASTIAAVIQALGEGKKPHLIGGNRDLMEMLRGVAALKAGETSDFPEFFGFANWNEVVEYARSDEGAHLVTFVNLVETRGEKQLMWALNRTVDAEHANLVISTAHKAKGREWKSVRLMDDFMKSQPTKDTVRQAGPDPAELRLLYVAITRAKEALDVPPPLVDLMAGRPVVQAKASTPPFSARYEASTRSRGQDNVVELKHVRKPPLPVTHVQPVAPKTPTVTGVDQKSLVSTPGRPKRAGFLKWLLGE